MKMDGPDTLLECEVFLATPIMHGLQIQGDDSSAPAIIAESVMVIDGSPVDLEAPLQDPAFQFGTFQSGTQILTKDSGGKIEGLTKYK